MGREANRIILKSKASHHEEAKAAAAGILPGMALEMDANGEVNQVQATKAEFLKGVAGLKIAEEDALRGKTVDDAYADDSQVLYRDLQPGDEFNALVKAAEDIAVGDTGVVEGGGSGLFVEAAGTEAKYNVEFLESSGGALAANALLSARVISV